MYQTKTDGNVAGNENINSTGPQRYLLVSSFSVLTENSTTGLGLRIVYAKKYVGL
jgi:hypothetical protein